MNNNLTKMELRLQVLSKNTKKQQKSTRPKFNFAADRYLGNNNVKLKLNYYLWNGNKFIFQVNKIQV